MTRYTCRLEPCGRVQFAPVVRGMAIFASCQCDQCRVAMAAKFARSRVDGQRR